MTVTLQPTAPPVVAPTGWGRLRLVLVLGALIALGPLTIDMYLPALPTIVDDLETTSAAVQLTLTGTLVGLALGQRWSARCRTPSVAAGRCWSGWACTYWRRC